MALLNSDMIREIRSVADEYSRKERERRTRVVESLGTDRRPATAQRIVAAQGDRA